MINKHAGYVFEFIFVVINPFVEKAELPTAWVPTQSKVTTIGIFYD